MRRHGSLITLLFLFYSCFQHRKPFKKMKTKFLTALSAFLFAFTAFNAQAGMVTDAHGNTGYDTAAECDAAVQNGTAKFYESFTHQKPLIRAGEKGVQKASIRDLGPEYRLGACDLGVGKKLKRDGVSTALQGKYVPYSPDFAVNAYTDATGSVVRVSMAQCDNWFSGNAPRPVSIPQVKPQPVPEPEPQPVPEPEPQPVQPTPEPVVESKVHVFPYVFGTMGIFQDGVRANANIVGNNRAVDETDTRFAGQAGVGIQLNRWLGGEIFYQTGRTNVFSERLCALNRTYGARATLGREINENTRLFLKAGAANVRHKTFYYGNGKAVVRPTAGIGISRKVNENLSFRADYDHYFKRSSSDKKAGNEGVHWKGANYLGAGLQYNF